MKWSSSLAQTVLSALFTALLIGSAYIILPWGPIPISLTPLFVVLSGMLGGLRVGMEAVSLYLILGLLGFPVFAGGASGLAILQGPTGGYLVGYLPAAFLGGLLYREGKLSPPFYLYTLAVALLASAVIYLPGLLWLKKTLGGEELLALGLYPFLLGDLIKAGGITLIAPPLKGSFCRYLEKDHAGS